ncbi:MAG: hypothetical protein AAF587_12785 [Bacteroidota bacterium]
MERTLSPMIRKASILCCLLWSFLSSLQAQEGFQEYRHLFDRQLPEFQSWLEGNQLDQLFGVNRLEVQSDQLILILQNAYQSDDSLKRAWEELRSQMMKAYRLRIGEEMLDYFTFLMRMKPDQGTIKVLGADGETLRLKIFYDQYQQFQTANYFPEQMGHGIRRILPSISSPTAVEVRRFKNDDLVNVGQVTDNIQETLFAYYGRKQARINIIQTAENGNIYKSFTMRASSLENEVLFDGQYEYFQIKVKAEQYYDEIKLTYKMISAFSYEEETSNDNPNPPELISIPNGTKEFDLQHYLDRLVTNSTDEINKLPVFSLNPPTPSARTTLDSRYFQKCQTLKDYDQILNTALKECGYIGRSYYAVPNGFALVSRLEYFNPSNGQAQMPGRWDGVRTVGTEFTVSRILQLLFGSNPGYYRIIVFIVTDQPVQPRGESPDREESNSWLIRGRDRLFSGNVNTTRKHAVTVLIYEFEQPESGREAKFLNYPGNKLNSDQHLRGSGLQEAFED